jgi:hypothetical protein
MRLFHFTVRDGTAGNQSAGGDLLCRGEIVFAYAANGAYPVCRDVCERSSGSNTAIGISHGRVINIPANVTYVLHVIKISG